MSHSLKVAVLGGGLAGCCAALQLAKYKKFDIHVYDKQSLPINAASLHNEGKLHLGYVYGADPDAATHKIMVHGSLSFTGVIEQLTGVKTDTFSRSYPFAYGVPIDSQLSLEQQVAHFQSVDQCIKDVFESGNSFYRSPIWQGSEENTHLLSADEMSGRFSTKTLQGVLQTNEYSVSTEHVSNVVGASLLSEPQISWVGQTEVLGAQALDNSRYQLRFQRNGEQSLEEYDAVINCLWEDRLRIDQSLGIDPPRPWLVRYKAAISGFSQELKDRAQLYPSLTLITGAYGDFVNHGDGNFYLSWYPKCKLGESRQLSYPDIEKAVSVLDEKKLVRESFSAMSEYLPALVTIEKTANNISVGGGYIFAWGKSDITDPVSGLHQRHLIGVESHGRWLSVNTGKYCTAPIFGYEAAQKLADIL